MSPRKTHHAGRLLLIGGHEDRNSESAILRRLVEMAGGDKARLIVCGAALEEADTTLNEYQRVFEQIGAAEVYPAHFPDRQAGEEQPLLDALEKATGVFFTGGDQLQITSRIGGTSFGKRVRERLEQEGLVVGGTSDGAPAMISTMVIVGPSDGTVRRADVELAPGLGFLRDVFIDTHFNARGRTSRVMAVHAHNPQVLGIGLDEDTAIDVTLDSGFQVLGSGLAMVFDGRVTHSNAAEIGSEDILALTDAIIHALPSGYGFDLKTMRPILPDGAVIKA